MIKFPGPTIRVNWGDTVSVTLKNSLKSNGTGIHVCDFLARAVSTDTLSYMLD
jgi:FtsP/CotA-like multicopper oxidase with cupredoxin domain